MNIDITIEIDFPIADPGKTVIRTNATQKGVDEILEAWLQDHLGQELGQSPHQERDVYHISIGLDLSDDTFLTKSDAGNNRLTYGIVATVFVRLKDITIQELSSNA